MESAKTAVDFFMDRYGFHPKQAEGHQRKGEYFRLMDLAKAKNFKRNDSGGYGFAAHAFKELFGEFPPFAWIDEWQAKDSGLEAPPKGKIQCPICHGTGWANEIKHSKAPEKEKAMMDMPDWDESER